MAKRARRDILNKLKSAPKGKTKPRPVLPPLPILSLHREELITRFSDNIAEQTGIVYRVKDAAEVKAKLSAIAASEQLTAIMVATDAIIAPLNLPEWGRKAGIEVLSAMDYANRETYREAVFNKVQAGITGADYGVAESGTICLIHDKNQPRLISIAPILHIAVLPLANLFSIYEQVTKHVFADKNNLPGHVTFTTGPSMTADIQGGQFKGMHGPGQLIVILFG